VTATRPAFAAALAGHATAITQAGKTVGVNAVRSVAPPAVVRGVDSDRFMGTAPSRIEKTMCDLAARERDDVQIAKSLAAVLAGHGTIDRHPASGHVGAE
jgi:hypothetical protein